MGYLALTVLLFARTWQAPTRALIGSATDPPQYVWYMRWMPYAIAHLQNPLLTDRLNVPAGANLMWNALMPLCGFVLWPITAIAGPVLAVNVLATLGVALSALCAYLALVRLTGSRWGSIAGGLLYGFSPYVMAQSHGHANLTFAPIPPLMVLVLHDVLVARRRSAGRNGLLLGMLATAQLLIWEELLACEVVVAAICVCILGLQHRDAVRQRARDLTVALATSLAVFVPLAAGPIAVQFLASPHLSGRVAPSGRFVTDLLNLVVPTDAQAVAPPGALAVASHFTGNAAEWCGYLGLPLLVIMARTAVKHRRDPLVRFWVSVAAAVTVLSLGPSLHVYGHDTGVPLPWRTLDAIPLINDILPSRLMLFTDFAAAVLISVMIGSLRRPSARRPLAVALLGLAAVSLAPKSFEASPAGAPVFFTSGAVEALPEGGVVLVVPVPSVFASQAMLWQAEAQMRYRMLGGYLVNADPLGRDGSAVLDAVTAVETGSSPPVVDATTRSRMLTELRARGVVAVVVGPAVHHDEEVRLITALLDTPPVSTGGVELWRVPAATAASPTPHNAAT